MRRALALVVLFLLLLGVCNCNVLAHPSHVEHDRELEAVVFNGKYSLDSSKLSKSEKQNLKMLKYATAICLDQFGQTSHQGDLNDLNDWGVKGIPKSVSEINPEPGQPSLRSDNHRMFTHRGWDYVYAIDLAKWSVRKNILISTTNEVFKNQFKNKKQCESFAALLYYIHVLGDYIEDVDSGDYTRFNGSSNGIKINFASAHPSETNRDIFYELEYHLKILFQDQTSKRSFKELISEIDDLAGRARSVVSQTGEINSYERLMEIEPLVHELMDILTGLNNQYNAIYELLKHEQFFTRAFPSVLQ